MKSVVHGKTKKGTNYYRFEMTESEFVGCDNDNEGLCVFCGEPAYGVEPDARDGMGRRRRADRGVRRNPAEGERRTGLEVDGDRFQPLRPRNCRRARPDFANFQPKRPVSSARGEDMARSGTTEFISLG